MPTSQTDVQQLIQSLTPSSVNNGNPNTVYNQPMPQGGYIPPTFDPGTNTWRINPAPPASTVDWKQMAMGQKLPTWGGAPVQPPMGEGVPVPQPPQSPTIPPGGVPTPGPITQPPVNVIPPPLTGSNDTGGLQPQVEGLPGGGTYDEVPTGCVVINSVLSDYDRADTVEVGDVMTVIDPVKFKTGKGVVSYSETKVMPCVRITTESGIELECSTTAPISDQYGKQVLAPDLLNKLIPVQDKGVNYLDRVISIEDIGEQEVRHITVEDNFFLAGKEKGRYIFHHNMKMGPYYSGPRIIDVSGHQSGDYTTTYGNLDGGSTITTQGYSSSPQFTQSPQQEAPLGQGIIDAFGNAAAPYKAPANDPWNGVLGQGSNAPSNPFGGGNLPAYDTQWFEDSKMYDNSLSPGNESIPTMEAVQAVAGPEGEQKSWLARLGNWADNNLAGNMYDENTGTWNKGNIGLGILDAVTGLPFSSGARRIGESGLFGDGGKGSAMARTQLQQEYDRNRNNPEAQQKIIQREATQHDTTPERVRELIGR